jgi:hypothetical protein
MHTAGTAGAAGGTLWATAGNGAGADASTGAGAETGAAKSWLSKLAMNGAAAGVAGNRGGVLSATCGGAATGAGTAAAKPMGEGGKAAKCACLQTRSDRDAAKEALEYGVAETHPVSWSAGRITLHQSKK